MNVMESPTTKCW